MAMSPNISGRGGGQEALLLDYARRLEKHRHGRGSVHLHLSGLQPYNRREQHIRAAASSFEPLVQSMQGQLFTLRNSDLVFIYKSESQIQVETVVQRIHFLFSDDPLLVEEEDSNLVFDTWYNVETQYDEFFYLVQSLVDIEQKQEEEKERKRVNTRQALKDKQETGEPLTPAVLERIEQALVRADLSNMVRRQFVCGIGPDMIPDALFSELFISIKDLQETLIPGVNLTSNRWLFQHLTETLDRRMLSMLNKNDGPAIEGDISCNMNVSTLLSQQFQDFNDGIPASRRGAMIVELQKVDVFADLGAYMFAREFVQDKGYRVCIDGLTHMTLPLVDRERLGADFIKMIWHYSMMDFEEEEIDHLRRLIARAGSGRVIMCRVDSEEAIRFGHTVGIVLFQGRQIETIHADDLRRRELLKVKRPRSYR
ncbi:MAG: hypothetical protein OEY85_01540 [Rhodospirillales bacterium]|nr:hypothetical protein [Rhodospirillales bacterium]